MSSRGRGIRGQLSSRAQPAGDLRMDAVMRTLKEIGNLIGQRTQERAATIIQAAEGVVATAANNNNGNQRQR